MTLVYKSLEAQIEQKAHEWGQAMVAALKAHQRETKAQLEHRKTRHEVLKIEEEMRELRAETMRLNIHAALANPVKDESIMSPIIVNQ